MTLFEKIKVNLEYLLGEADSSLYSNRESKSLSEWTKRWEEFSADGCGFIWYGVDIEGNIAEFSCDESYVPEIFFQDAAQNNVLMNYFENLPERTETLLPDNLRLELRELAEKHNKEGFWTIGANKGLFIFDEMNNRDWYDWENDIQVISNKNLYELNLIPNVPLKFAELPKEIQLIIKPYKFINLSFTDCQFLDISKHFYCVD